VDDVYMLALQSYFQAIGSPSSGGWPLSMFLTPDGKPLAGGTYFPPDSENDRQGFQSVMQRLLSAWKDQRDDMERNAEYLTRVVQNASKPRPNITPVTLDRALVTAAVDAVVASADPDYGGFDFDPLQQRRPKFPTPVKIALLQYDAAHGGSADAARVTRKTLDAIAAGGIHDQLGGGFHRYSTDRFWRVPHFEKMLYDNAQLIDAYTTAYQQTHDPRYRAVAESACDFVLRELHDPQGGFYSALDAETDGVEGLYYAWTRKEIQDLLTAPEFQLASAVFGLDRAPNFEDKYVLEIVRTPASLADASKGTPPELEQQFAQLRGKLLKARGERKPVLRDDKVLTSWNGLMIGALAHAGDAFERDDYVQSAEEGAKFVLSRMRDDKGRLLRTWRAGQAKLPAYLDDYAFLVQGLIALHDATGEARWINAAVRLTDSQLELFWDDKLEACFFTAKDHEPLLARSRSSYDSALPSGNSVTARNLLRLADLAKQPKYRERAQTLLQTFGPQLQQTPRGSVVLAIALAESLGKGQISDRQTAGRRSDVIQTAGEKTPKKPKAKATEEHVKGKAYLSVDKLPAGSTCQFVVQLTIDDDWHINPNPAADEFTEPTELTITAQHKVEAVKLQFPPPQKIDVPGLDKPLLAWEKQVEIRGTLEIPESAGGKTEELQFEVNYQACCEKKCLRPQTLTITVPVSVARKGEPVKQINQKLFPPKK
jgi:uncharacterized protein YyaL (SSP411 family)